MNLSREGLLQCEVPFTSRSRSCFRSRRMVCEPWRHPPSTLVPRFGSVSSAHFHSWVRIYELSIEYWHSSVLLSIPRLLVVRIKISCKINRKKGDDGDGNSKRSKTKKPVVYREKKASKDKEKVTDSSDMPIKNSFSCYRRIVKN